MILGLIVMYPRKHVCLNYFHNVYMLVAPRMNLVLLCVTSSVAEWLGRSLRVWEVRGSIPARVKPIKDFKLVVEAPLSSARHIKGSSTKILVDPLPE